MAAGFAYKERLKLRARTDSPLPFAMSPRVPFLVLPLMAVSAAGLPAAAQQAQPAIAGLAPHERPAEAPILGQFSPDLGWRARTLHGVSEPVPPALRFIDSQGAWYTPFDRPGMTGRYDLRGWHVPAVQ
jgi:hypothetical protein